MTNTKQRNATRNLTESALMIALAAVLSLITVYKLPNGGSITAASMVPIILIGLRAKPSWAILTALAYSGVQMLLGGVYPPPTPTLFYFILVILLDYVVAFGVLGLAGFFARPFKNRRAGAAVSALCVCALRFVCHYLSGLLIWGSGEPGVPAWLFSLTYNASYMIPETIISVAVAALLAPYLEFGRRTSKA